VLKLLVSDYSAPSIEASLPWSFADQTDDHDLALAQNDEKEHQTEQQDGKGFGGFMSA
jgi:hypothetical protein